MLSYNLSANYRQPTILNNVKKTFFFAFVLVTTFLMDEYYVNIESLAKNPEVMKENIMASYGCLNAIRIEKLLRIGKKI